MNAQQQLELGRCSKCNELKEVKELNGYDTLASEEHKFDNAYCINLALCDCYESRLQLDNIVRKLFEDDTEDDLLPCPHCGSTDLVPNKWSLDSGEVDAIECGDCDSGATLEVWNQRKS